MDTGEKFKIKLRDLLKEFKMDVENISFIFLPEENKNILAIKYEEIEV